jgi:cytochrome c553
MRRSLIAARITAAVALLTASALAQDVKGFKSISVEIPDGDKMFPGGSEADATNNNCLSCHSVEMVLNQAPLPKATWEAEVQKMIKAYKAPIDAADVAPIVDYLVKTKGKN